MVVWPSCSGPLVTQSTMAEVHDRGTCLLHGHQESWRKREENVQSANIPFKGTPLVTGFLQPYLLKFYHRPIAPTAGDQAFKTGAFGGHLRSKQ
jgi:hypothetical protein